MNKLQRLTGVNAFYALIGGQLLSTIGSGMTRFGLGVWVLNETGDTTAYTIMLFLAVFPIGLGALIAGPLIDRWNRRNVMIVGNIIASLSTLFIAMAFFLDDLALWQLYVAVFVNGIANAFILPSLQSSTPLLVPRDQLNRAAGLNQLVRATEMIVAPGIAGFVVGSLGLGAIFIVDFVTFGFAILALLITIIPQPKRTSDRDAKPSIWRDFVFGLKYIRQRRPLVYLLGLFALTMFLLPGVGYSLVAPYVLTFSTEEVLGLIISSYGVGAFIGGVLMTGWRTEWRRMIGMLTALALAGFAAILIGLTENAWVVGIAFFLTGISLVFVSGLNRVIWQVKVAPDVQGRVFALQAAIGVAAQSLGILLAGPLSSRVFEPLLLEGGALFNSVGSMLGTGAGRGIALMFVVLGVLELLIVVFAYAKRSVRLLEDDIPDYDFEAADLVSTPGAKQKALLP